MFVVFKATAQVGYFLAPDAKGGPGDRNQPLRADRFFAMTAYAEGPLAEPLQGVVNLTK